MSGRFAGTVKWLNTAKGYSFMGRQDGEEVSVHFSANNMGGYRRLIQDRTLEFSVEDRAKGLQAANVGLKE